MKRRPIVVLILGQRRRQWYYIQSTERKGNVFTGPSECVFISQANIYLYKSTKAQWTLLIDTIWIPNSEVWNLDKKLIKPSPNIIVTWKSQFPSNYGYYGYYVHVYLI